MHASTATTAAIPMRVVRFMACDEQGLYPSGFCLTEAAPGLVHHAIELPHGVIAGHRRALAAVNGDRGERRLDVGVERPLVVAGPRAGESQDLPQDPLGVRLQSLEIDPQHLLRRHL